MSSTIALRQAVPSESPAERDIRVELAACYRLIAHFGMDDLVFTHISARVPGEQDRFLINPYGMMFHEITASSLVKIDHEANIVQGGSHGVNQAGFVIHSAVHAARPEINCVLHCHTRAGVAVSCLEEGLLPLNQFSLNFYNRIAYHDYEGIALELDEQTRLQRDLDDKKVMILRNHGLLTAGATVAEAFSLMYYLEQSCRVQLDVMASGGTIRRLSGQVSERTARQFETLPSGRGQREWPALLRLLDAKDPSYRH